VTAIAVAESIELEGVRSSLLDADRTDAGLSGMGACTREHVSEVSKNGKASGVSPD
jgi:hypothetical protein